MKPTAFVALFLLLVVSCVYGDKPINLTQSQRDIVKGYAKECIAQEHIAQETLENLQQCKTQNIERNGKCFTNCIQKKVGLMIDGVFQSEKIKSILGPNLGMDKLEPIMAKCNGLTGSDECEMSFEIYSCYCKEHAQLA